MKQDNLAQLLRRADRAAGGPSPLPGDLAERVRRLADQRRQVRVWGSAVAAALILVLSGLAGTQFPRHRPTLPDSPNIVAAPTPTQELLAIKIEAERLRAELLAAQPVIEEPADHQPTDPSDDPSPYVVTVANSVDRERERAAYLIVYQGDRYGRELNMPESAIASYRQTVELFPRTRAAQTARDRLSQLENAKGTQS